MTCVTVREFFMIPALVRHAVTGFTGEHDPVSPLVAVHAVKPAMPGCVLRKHVHLFPVTASAVCRRDILVESKQGGCMGLMAPQTVFMLHFVTVRLMAFRTLHEFAVRPVAVVAVLL